MAGSGETRSLNEMITISVSNTTMPTKWKAASRSGGKRRPRIHSRRTKNWRIRPRRQCDDHRLAAAAHFDLDRLVQVRRRRIAEGLDVDRLAVEAGQHVAGLNARRGGGAVG